MKKSILDQLEAMDNNSLLKLSELSDEIIKKRHQQMLNLVTEQSIDMKKIKSIAHYFKKNELPHNIVNYLHQKKYKENDIEFVNFILEDQKFSITHFHKQKIYEQFVLSSLSEPAFFDKIEKTDDTDTILLRKMKKDGFNDVDPSIFISLAQKYDLKINTDNIGRYISDETLPVFKVIHESSYFSQFFQNGNYLKKTILKAIEKESIESIESFISFFKIKKEAKLFFSDPKQIENLCKTKKLDFFEYVMTNFKCDNDNYVFLMNVLYYIPRSGSLNKEKTVIAVDALVKNNFENKDFVEQIKRKIEISSYESFKDLALKQFSFAFLENSMPEKISSTLKIKI